MTTGACIQAVTLPALATLMLAASMTFTPSLAISGDGIIIFPESGAVLRGGDLVTLRWNSLPDEIEEFEIILSIDGGERYSIRLTPQTEPSTESCCWQVPNIPADNARIRLRIGYDGREFECPESHPFHIIVRDHASQNIPHFREGEWWVDGDTQSGLADYKEYSNESACERGESSFVFFLTFDLPHRPNCDQSNRENFNPDAIASHSVSEMRRQTLMLSHTHMIPMRQ